VNITLERQLADKAGLGWTGKHSLIINKEAGSWFFLGELFVDIPLPVDKPVEEQCGSCVACIKLCPTNAIVEPYVVDARRCISYFTIESPEPIPLELRPLMGNRIYGCDDCQLICPWNRYGQITDEKDFHPRTQLKDKDLIELFLWDEVTFLKNTEGSPIRRIGHERWLRNISVALGNAAWSQAIIDVLQQRLVGESELVEVHILWALEQQQKKQLTNKKTQRLIKAIEKGLPRDA
jgi:epoxyqueuosine reductase